MVDQLNSDDRLQSFLIRCSFDSRTNPVLADLKMSGTWSNSFSQGQQYMDKIVACSVISVNYANVTYNIITGQNDTLLYYFLLPVDMTDPMNPIYTERTIVVPPGFYTAAQLATYLVTAINAEEVILSTSYVVASMAQDSVTGQYVITVNGDIRILQDNTMTANVNFNKTIGWLITTPSTLMPGLYEQVSTIVGAGPNYTNTGTFIPQLQGLTDFDCVCDVYVSNLVQAPTATQSATVVNTGCCVPVTESFGAIGHFVAEMNTSIIRFSQPRSIRSIRIRYENPYDGSLISQQGFSPTVIMRMWSVKSS